MLAVGGGVEDARGVEIRPGRGRIPSCSAPTTLPRRSAGSTLTSAGRASSSNTARSVAAADADSARLARPATITTSARAS